jgi:hypothetical protein
LSWFVVGSHLVSSLCEMKLALSREQESQCTFQGGNIQSSRLAAFLGERLVGYSTMLIPNVLSLAKAATPFDDPDWIFEIKHDPFGTRPFALSSR